ncbi:DUF3919 family protein [Clostridium ganghwense]|uniref:DUF3919 family protein n=1 Tax=Clostridium ganghwense TaxID=312089 RepID=A0ABT4CUP3_9CLOT|nr:DUF3919 family protein [Clostridium ganghwense]MCY6372777.1 DUF3919 family protein [Clostridium ganghwense]
MKRINTKIRIILVYMITITISIIAININYNKLYNKVKIIDDREEVIKKASMSIPVKIEFFNEKWGRCVLEDKNSINNIWNFIDEIMKSTSKRSDYKIDNTSPINIVGNIYYLNGMKCEFQVSNVLKLNNYIYGDSYKLPIINNLRNSLLSYLYSPNNLAQFISQTNKVILMDKLRGKVKFGNSDKDKIRNLISKAIKLEDDKEIMDLTRRQTYPSSHIKVYMDQENDNYLKVKSYNVINIDIYDEFFIVQYLGDENGRHIYMKGNLKNICDELSNNYSNKFN